MYNSVVPTNILKDKNVNNVKITKNKLLENSEKKLLIPKFNEYDSFLNNKYKLPELKQICKKYKLPLTGKKSILIEKIHDYLKKSFYIEKIQKNIEII